MEKNRHYQMDRGFANLSSRVVISSRNTKSFNRRTKQRIDVILSEENLSKAIGRRGQNVRLASKLINYEIDILTDKEDSERRQAEFKERTEIFVNNLEVDEILGQLLVSENFQNIEEIANSKIEDISKIEGIETLLLKN
jgi:N utilization substance protein A